MKLEVHKAVLKATRKAPIKIKIRANNCIEHIQKFGLTDLPFRMKPLQGRFKKGNYWEILIDKDYRLIFRVEEDTVFVRHAGTHNDLGTG